MPASLIRIPSPSANASVPLAVPPSIKLSSAAVDVTAVEPRTRLPSGITIREAPARIKSSTDSSQSMYAPEVAPKNLTS